jgi:GTP 3',8-cyclase
VTRWGDLDKVLHGIAAAKDAGLAVKINAVALKGVSRLGEERLRNSTCIGGHDAHLCLVDHRAFSALLGISIISSIE